MKDSYLILSRQAVEKFVREGKKLIKPADLPPELVNRQAGVFVSLHQKDNQRLRGCIGTFAPTRNCLAEEIINNAIAATQDPRFPQLKKDELPNLTYKVDVLSPPQPDQAKNLDPRKLGLLVESPDGRRGLLLPDLPGIDTPEKQLHFCLKKAGIAPWEKYKIHTFTVERHEEKDLRKN